MTRHAFDALSFVAGLFVLAAGLLLLSGGLGSVRLEWVGPVVAISLGAGILYAARSASPHASGTEPEPEPGPDSDVRAAD